MHPFNSLLEQVDWNKPLWFERTELKSVARSAVPKVGGVALVTFAESFDAIKRPKDVINDILDVLVG